MAIHPLLDLQPLILNLQKEIALAENVAQAVSILARLVILLVHDRFRHRSAQARRQRDQTLVVLCQEVVINPGLVVETFQKTGRHQLD